MHTAPSRGGWLGPTDAPLGLFVEEMTERNLRAYEAQPLLVDEHAGQEENLSFGGYGRRQLLELIQNGADEQIDIPGGRIEVLLTAEHLYCANEGSPITEKGINALLLAHTSPKRGAEIGRFGLGFKSVLGVTSRPQFFCREASFGFDENWARGTISNRVPNKESYPVLRLARLLDPNEEAVHDPMLREFMSWATTVVRLPLDKNSEWLHTDIEEFNREFLLFSPHVGAVILDDLTTGLRREISVRSQGDTVLLGEGGKERQWRLFQTQVEPSAAARRDAGKLGHREHLPVVWAVPVEGRLEIGQFWAFFPLRDETTLSGIANAPWQINDDRTGLLENSRLNEELLSALVDMMLQKIPELVTPDDPGRVLEILPARGREARCWADDVVTRNCQEREASYPLVPDQEGHLRRIDELDIPDLALPLQAWEKWSEHGSRPAKWAHSSAAASPTRRNRVERILESAGRTQVNVADWLGALIDDNDIRPADSAAAIKVAGVLASDESEWQQFGPVVRSAFVVLTSDGELARADPDWIWISPDGEDVSSSLKTVDSAVAADAEALGALRAIGVQTVTPEVELVVWIEEAEGETPDHWDTVWKTVRRIEAAEVAAKILAHARTEGNSFCVRTRGGRFRPVERTMLPGRVIPEDSRDDDDVLIDVAYHSADLEVLRLAGATSTPRGDWLAKMDDLVSSYERICVKAYREQLARSGAQPTEGSLGFRETVTAGPLEPLELLSDAARARFSNELLGAAADLSPWTIEHRTQSHRYPSLQYPNPVVWAIREHGYLPTSRGPRRPGAAFAPALSDWESLLPVARLTDAAAEALGLPVSLDTLTDDQWRACFSLVAEATDDRKIGGFYCEAAARSIRPPDPMRCRIGSNHGSRPPSEVVVTDRPDTFEALGSTGDAVIKVGDPEGVRLLVEHWGLQPASGRVSHEPSWVPVGESVPLVDTFPTLRSDLTDAGFASYGLLACTELRVLTTTERGTEARDCDYLTHEGQILYIAELGLAHVLARLDQELDLKLTEAEIEDLVAQTWRQQQRERLASIRSQPTHAQRLLTALGAETIRMRLPIGLLEAVRDLEGDPTDEELAELLLVVHGYDTLHALRDDLMSASFDPPDRWAGSSNARRFVKDLGFPSEYAGFPSSQREPSLLVPGRSELPELHDYQKRMVVEIRDLLGSGSPHPRGLLSLPTGAGKTRVAVQALTEALVGGVLSRPVLWIAQSDELCEQAVEAWFEVWRSAGAKGDLTVSRLWGPTNEAEETVDGPQIVVATPDKLRSRVDSEAYDWLANASCVVIDEAHHATTPEYTRILEWQGILSRGATMRTRAPLLGLTATPFRGTSEEQTNRLIQRFGRRRLDVGMADRPYEELRDLGVLSRVEGEILEGIAVKVDEAQAAEFSKLGDMPKSIFRELASDADRNRRILESITSKPDDWQILLFAASIEHAHTMAALLSRKGIRAAAIDHGTDGGLRRRYIEEFGARRLRVLCNYNVLSQGFDAPAVRAIYVTRPIFSPNAYQQMIGRGLRGPKNRGDEFCLVVNVLDNWSRFGDQLAFREFEPLWGKG